MPKRQRWPRRRAPSASVWTTPSPPSPRRHCSTPSRTPRRSSRRAVVNVQGSGGSGGTPQVLGGVGASGGTVTMQSFGVLEFQEQLLFLLPQLTTNGAASVEQVVTLPKTAVLDPLQYVVTVHAGRAQWTLASNVGQVRKQDASGVSGRTTVVVDFGVLRTVAAVGLLDTSKLSIIQVKPWTG